MQLRSPNSGSKGATRRLRAALVAAALVGAFVAAGASSAGVSDYPSPLYLSGGPSSVVTGSFQLLGSIGPSVTTTPTVTAGGAGSGVLSGQYSYIYVAGSGGAYPASAASPATS